jgi:hypothetical protein
MMEVEVIACFLPLVAKADVAVGARVEVRYACELLVAATVVVVNQSPWRLLVEPLSFLLGLVMDYSNPLRQTSLGLGPLMVLQ